LPCSRQPVHFSGWQRVNWPDYDTDEAELSIFDAEPGYLVSRKEISRKAKRRDEYEENPHWAAAPLHSCSHKKKSSKTMPAPT